VRIAPTMQLITIIVQTSIKQQAKNYCFFVALTQADAVASQALIELLADFLLVRDRPRVWLQTFGVLFYADFLR